MMEAGGWWGVWPAPTQAAGPAPPETAAAGPGPAGLAEDGVASPAAGLGARDDPMDAVAEPGGAPHAAGRGANFDASMSFGSQVGGPGPLPASPGAAGAAGDGGVDGGVFASSFNSVSSSGSSPGGSAANAAPWGTSSLSLSRKSTLNLSLNLASLKPDDNPPTELQMRREKFSYYERHCSQVAEGLYVAGDPVARDRELLRSAGVTHVLNCVGFVCPEYFASELVYRTLWLQDTPAEDITSVLYDAFDYVLAAQAAGGRVLIHCSQGVSRSAALAIGFLMWTTQRPYDVVYAQVKAARGVVNPNMGFTCQLLHWYKTRAVMAAGGVAAAAASGLSDALLPRLYRLCPHSVHDPQYLVPKPAARAAAAALDPRGAFVLHVLVGEGVGPSGAVILWIGSAAEPAYVAAAQTAATQLGRYEGAPAPAGPPLRGGEPLPPELAALLGAAPGEPVGVAEVSAYDTDFALFACGVRPAPRPGWPAGAARAGPPLRRVQSTGAATVKDMQAAIQLDEGAPSPSPNGGGASASPSPWRPPPGLTISPDWPSALAASPRDGPLASPGPGGGSPSVPPSPGDLYRSATAPVGTLGLLMPDLPSPGSGGHVLPPTPAGPRGPTPSPVGDAGPSIGRADGPTDMEDGGGEAGHSPASLLPLLPPSLFNSLPPTPLPLPPAAGGSTSAPWELPPRPAGTPRYDSQPPQLQPQQQPQQAMGRYPDGGMLSTGDRGAGIDAGSRGFCLPSPAAAAAPTPRPDYSVGAGPAPFDPWGLPPPSARGGSARRGFSLPSPPTLLPQPPAIPPPAPFRASPPPPPKPRGVSFSGEVAATPRLFGPDPGAVPLPAHKTSLISSELFEYPDYTQLGMPDLDDLLHEGAYVLWARPRGAPPAPCGGGSSPEAEAVFVWIGTYCAAARSSGGAQAFAQRVAREFCEHAGLGPQTAVHVEMDGDESELFWARFEGA